MIQSATVNYLELSTPSSILFSCLSDINQQSQLLLLLLLSVNMDDNDDDDDDDDDDVYSLAEELCK